MRAYTVAELGEMLPHYVDDIGYIDVPDCIGQGQGWWFNIKDRHAGNSRSEANARAEMLIYLIENNLLPSAQISPEPTSGPEKT